MPDHRHWGYPVCVTTISVHPILTHSADFASCRRHQPPIDWGGNVHTPTLLGFHPFCRHRSSIKNRTSQFTINYFELLTFFTIFNISFIGTVAFSLSVFSPHAISELS